MNFQFVMPKTLFSKSFDTYRHPSKNFARIVPSVSWTAKPMAIRSPPNEDELKAFFVSFGYSVEIGKKFRRIYLDEQVSSTAESSKLESATSSLSTHQLYCGKKTSNFIFNMVKNSFKLSASKKLQIHFQDTFQATWPNVNYSRQSNCMQNHLKFA